MQIKAATVAQLRESGYNYWSSFSDLEKWSLRNSCRLALFMYVDTNLLLTL